jgi:hypothetical protein
MALIIKDRVKEITTTTGTGDVSLGGASATFDAFQSVMSNGDTTFYAIVHTASGTDEWEVGVGTFNTGNTLTRTTVYAGSNGASAVNFSSGNKDVFMTYPASKAAVAGEDVTFADVTATDITATGTVTLSGDPTSALQAATKEYVDTIAAAGIHYHTPVRVEAPSALTATYDNGTSGVGATLTNSGTQAALVIDGVTLSTSDRVLVYNQTNAAHNGVYTVTDTGSASSNWVLTRATDADSYGASDPNAMGEGDAYFVKEGDTGAGELYVMNTSGTITFGTTAITFTVIAETAVYSAGDSLTLTGTTFDTVQDIRTTASPTFNNITVTGTVDGRDVATDGSKLDGIESGATADQTAAEIKTAYESNSDTNAFTDAEKTKLSGVEAGATADQSASEILTAIKTVDGASSGLDADLLDGQQGSYYLNTSTTFSGDVSGTYNNIVVTNDSHTHDGRYYTESEADSRFVNVTGDTMSGNLVVASGNASQVILDNSNDSDYDVKLQTAHDYDGWFRVVDGGGTTRFSVGRNSEAYIGGIGGSGGNRAFHDSYHPNADKWTTARTLSLSGDASGSVSWDGSANATLNVTVANDSHTHDGRYYTESEANTLFVARDFQDTSRNLNIATNSTANSMGLFMKNSSGAFGFQLYGDGTSYGFLDGDWASWDIQKVINGQFKVDEGSGLQRVFNDGYHPNADAWTTARTLSLSGDASGSVSWDGSANATLSVTVANDSHSHSNYITSNANDSMSGILTFTSTNNAFAEYNGSGTAPYLRFKTSGTNNGYIQFESNGNAYFWNDRANQGIRVQSGASGLSWYDGGAYRTVWHSANDGSGSGLDADLLDGQHASAFQPAASELTWVDPATGNYGTIKVDDDRGVTYAGYAIRDDWVFMSNGAAEAGIYNDTDNEWGILMAQNARTALFYNGDEQFRTESAGVSTDRGMRIGAFGNPHNGNGLEVTGTGEEKIVLSGATNPYIRFQEGSTDRAYIQWNAGGDALRFHNQQSDYFDFRPHDTGGAVNIRLRGSDDDTWGSLYADDNGGTGRIGFLDDDQGWAYRITSDSLHEWFINGSEYMQLSSTGLSLHQNSNDVLNFSASSTNDARGISFNGRTALSSDDNDGYLRLNQLSEFSNGVYTPSRLRTDEWLESANGMIHQGDSDTAVTFNTNEISLTTGGSTKAIINSTGVRLGDSGNGYFRPVSGSYGSIEIDGGAHNGWEGYSIGGRVVFMHDNSTATGIYNDANNEWLFYGLLNSYTRMYFNGSSKLETTSTGVTVTGDLNSTSDIRYKKNIETIDSALEKVQSLRGVTFDWDNDAFEEKEDTKKPNFTERATGVIAQDVEKVLPEAVHENKDGFKNVAYGNMVGLLIEAIKEQQEQIDALKAQLNG